jgi:hypothetical protein
VVAADFAGGSVSGLIGFTFGETGIDASAEPDIDSVVAGQETPDDLCPMRESLGYSDLPAGVVGFADGHGLGPVRCWTIGHRTRFPRDQPLSYAFLLVR